MKMIAPSQRSPRCRHSNIRSFGFDSSFEFRHSNFRQKRAFTLIEVLVSLAIISILLPSIMYGLNLANRGAALARNRTQAATLAQQKLDEIVALGPLQDASGDFPEDSAHYTWTATLAPFDSPAANGLTATIEQLTVTVTWQQENQPRSLALSTLIYQSASENTGLPGGILP
jgi:prepilin-type N-terminal cleavage/methylation domain-containing protein